MTRVDVSANLTRLQACLTTGAGADALLVWLLVAIVDYDDNVYGVFLICIKGCK